MPPKGATKAAGFVKREPSIERTTEYDEFIKTLGEYHEKRGYVVCARIIAHPMLTYARLTAQPSTSTQSQK